MILSFFLSFSLSLSLIRDCVSLDTPRTAKSIRRCNKRGDWLVCWLGSTRHARALSNDLNHECHFSCLLCCFAALLLCLLCLPALLLSFSHFDVGATNLDKATLVTGHAGCRSMVSAFLSMLQRRYPLNSIRTDSVCADERERSTHLCCIQVRLEHALDVPFCDCHDSGAPTSHADSHSSRNRNRTVSRFTSTLYQSTSYANQRFSKPHLCIRDLFRIGTHYASPSTSLKYAIQPAWERTSAE